MRQSNQSQLKAVESLITWERTETLLLLLPQE